MLRVTENICDAMTKYSVRAKVSFRYKRGGKYSSKRKTTIVKGERLRQAILSY